MSLKKAKLFYFIVSISCAFVVFPAADCSAQYYWTAPAEFKTLKNPFAGKRDVDNVGKDLWIKHCKSCHGKEGDGDGRKADKLYTELRSFSTNEVQSQTDGELYYKSIIGTGDMPNYEKKIPSMEDRWLLINYIRTLNYWL